MKHNIKKKKKSCRKNGERKREEIERNKELKIDKK